MRLVIKIGSNLLAGTTSALNTRRIRSIAKAVAALRDEGHSIVLVSSGAVAAGMRKLGLTKKPSEIKLKQAAAAAGQSSLMWAYDREFSKFGIAVAQVLLTQDGLANRKMYINAKNTLQTLLDYGVVPIVNENDTVATDEIKFGDNDQLAALVAALGEANKLIILSDVDGLFSADPKRDGKAKLVQSVTAVTAEMLKQAGKSISGVGTGGMYSKLMAAQKAMRSGIGVHIISGHRPGRLSQLMAGAKIGTEFVAEGDPLTARKGWIAFGSSAKGSIRIDDGAVKAVARMNRSLLPSGITSVAGKFAVGDAVDCVDGSGRRIAKGLTNYSSDELQKIMGLRTSEIEKALGYRYSDEVIHRDNLVLSE